MGVRQPNASVTVIIPTYNRAVFLKEAVQSILEQTVKPSQIFIVDDGSTDDTQSVAESFGGSINYIGKDNGGKSAALNLAMGFVQSEFVWIFDDDDVALPLALETMLEGINRSPDYGFAYGPYSLFTSRADGSRKITAREFPPVAPTEVFPALLKRSFIHQPGLLVRKACYDAVGPFDETLIRSQDFEMMLRLARHTQGIQVGGPLFLQRQHAGTRGTGAKKIKAADIEKAWRFYDRQIMRRFYDRCALSEFLPNQRVGTSETVSRFSALLVRSAMTGRRGLWDLAAQDLSEAARLAQLATILRLSRPQIESLAYFFDVFGDSASNYLESKTFQQALKNIIPLSLARDVRLGISAGIPYLVRQALKQRHYGRAWLLMRVYVRIASPSVIAIWTWRRIGSKLIRKAKSALTVDSPSDGEQTSEILT